jgi:hypothetical protein
MSHQTGAYATWMLASPLREEKPAVSVEKLGTNQNVISNDFGGRFGPLALFDRGKGTGLMAANSAYEK